LFNRIISILISGTLAEEAVFWNIMKDWIWTLTGITRSIHGFGILRTYLLS